MLNQEAAMDWGGVWVPMLPAGIDVGGRVRSRLPSGARALARFPALVSPSRAAVFDFAEEAWSNNWAWGLPLIVLTVLVHAFGLVVIRDRVMLELPLLLRARRSEFVLAVLMIVTVLLLTVLHAVEAGAWAGAYVILGARADFASAMLYSSTQ